MKKAPTTHSILVALLTMGALCSVASADIDKSSDSLSSGRLVAIADLAASDNNSLQEFPSRVPARVATGHLQSLISSAPIRFGTSTSELSPVSRQNLRQLVVPILLGTSNQKILVEGHADLNGLKATNDRIARQRAEQVSQYLIQIGVPANMIVVRSAGASRPLVADRTAVGNQVNRRVELHLSF